MSFTNTNSFFFVKILPFLFVVFLLISFIPINYSNITDFIKKFNQSQLECGAEKLFIHTDKPLYFAGEDIWFQSYLTNPSSSLPITYEKILYLELLNPSGVTMQKCMFYLDNGKCNGTLTLKDNLTDGKYLILAYTNWMRNQGSDFFFKKEITILSEKESANILNSENTDAIDSQSQTSHAGLSTTDVPTMANLQLSFLPEGGDLIAGLFSRVAFVGINQSGKAMEFEGKIVDEEGNSFGNFKTMHKGKGYFLLRAEANKKYKAIVEGNKGEVLEFPLPEVKESGYSLKVENPFQGDSICLSIFSHGIHPKSAFTIVAQQDGKLKDILQGQLINHKIQFNVNKHLFKTGIVHFTLFNAQMIPQCERLAFINHHDELDIQIKGLENDYFAQEIDLEIELKDKKGNPVQGEFSMAVTDAQKVNDNYYNSHNLLNYTYLTSNLPGKIDDPAFYLEKNAQAHIATDLLMMVNGWRRFKWEEILCDSLVMPKYKPEQGIYLKGKLKRKSNNKYVPKGIGVNMMVGNILSPDFTTTTDENGAFYFKLNNFYDNINVVVQTKNRLNVGADYLIELESNLSFEATSYYTRKLMLTNESVPTIFYEAEKLKPNEYRVETDYYINENRRFVEDPFFEDTTDVQIEAIDVIEQRKLTSHERIAKYYGQPITVVEELHIEKMIDEIKWVNGLATIIYDAIPGLCVSIIPGYDKYSIQRSALRSMYKTDYDKYKPSEARNNRKHLTDGAQFTLEGEKLQPFIIYIDGKASFKTDNNGVLWSASSFLSINPREIKSIELHRKGIYNVLAFYSQSGNGLNASPTELGISKYKLYGFERIREFYAPQYTNINNNTHGGNESTLYWYPLIKTDSLGKAKVSFYNVNKAHKIRCDIAGFSNTGIPLASIITKGNDSISIRNKETQELKYDTDSIDYDVSEASITSAYIINENKLANISVKGKLWSTVSNNEGKFIIDRTIVSDFDTLLIEIPSYSYAELTLAEIMSNGNKMELQLTESIPIQNQNADRIIKKMFKEFDKSNTSISPSEKGAYRECVYKNNNLLRVSDLTVVHGKPTVGHSSIPRMAKILNGRHYRTNNYKNEVQYELRNSLSKVIQTADPFMLGSCPLISEHIQAYDFKLVGLVKYLGRDMYHITFNQKEGIIRALLKGFMLVDKETYGLAYINWQQSNNGKKYETSDMFLNPSVKAESFDRLKDNNESFYSLKDETWTLKMSTKKISFKIDNANMYYTREFELVTPLGNQSEKYDTWQSLPIKVKKHLVKHPIYNPESWREAWCLPTEDYIYEQVKHLHEVLIYESDID